MTEEDTVAFITDYEKMTRDELHGKWGRFAVESNEENDKLIRGPQAQ
jgi:hypothetical protein